MSLSWRVDSSARVQPVEFGRMAAPGECLLCKRIGKDPLEVFAGLGVELEFYGVAYLCLECCSEIAGFINFVNPDLVTALENANREYFRRNTELSNQLEEAKALIHVRIESAGSSKSSGDGSPDLPISSVDGSAADVDRILNEYQPELTESSKS